MQLTKPVSAWLSVEDFEKVHELPPKLRPHSPHPHPFLAAEFTICAT